MLKELKEAEKIQKRKIPMYPIRKIFYNASKREFMNYTRDYIWGFKYKIK